MRTKHIALFLALLMSSASAPAYFGTTGKLTGVVKDAQTGEPLIGATILLQGTKLGAKTNFDGEYTILNIPPGQYSLRVTYIGYQAKTIEKITIRVDLTTRIDVELSSQSVQAEEVVVSAERPIVVKDQTFSSAVVSGEQIQKLPVEDVSQVIRLQSGIVGGSFRGGRFGEVGYLVDGVTVTDVFDGNAGRGGSTFIDPQSIQEVQVITGAFNAEYGQAMSGIVNIVTKEGGENYAGQVQIYGGDYLTGRRDLYRNLNNFSAFATPNMQASLGGPVPFLRDKLSFYVAGRYFRNEGYLFGRRQFRTDDVLQQGNPANPYNAPAIAGRFRQTTPDDPNAIRTFRNEQGIPISLVDERGNPVFIATDENGRAIIDRQNGTRVFIPFSVNDQFGLEQRFNRYENFGSGDNASIPLNEYERYSIQGKLTFRPTSTFKAFYSFNYEDENFRGYDHAWQLNPDGELQNFRSGFTNILGVTYTINSNTFLDGRYSLFRTGFKNFAFEDPFDPRYQDLGVPGAVTRGVNFVHGGTKNSRVDRTTTTNQLRLDLTTQFNKHNLIKAGIDVKHHNLDFQFIEIRDRTGEIRDGFQPYIPDAETEFGHDRYTRNPIEFAAYIQDKLEFENFIINLGIRFDYFNSRDQVPTDPLDPSLFFRIDSDSVFAARNGFSNRRKDATPKFAFSPRVGVSFPITERGVFYFSYGQFFQIPNFNLLYENALFKFRETDITSRINSAFGNPDIRPQRTISGEIGIQQQIGETIGLTMSAYYRDIRDLAGSAFARQLITGGQYFVFENTDYAFVRGIVATLSKRLSQSISFNINYTLQFAQGNAPDPRTAIAAIAGGNEPETQLLRLDWDQTHTLNAEALYDDREWNFSVIGRYGSGFPYSPTTVPQPPTQGLARLFQNGGLRPQTFTVDLRATRNLKIGDMNVAIFAQVFNLFDAANETTVFATTGRATYDLYRYTTSEQNQAFNSLPDFFVRPDFFSEPRRITLGMSVNF
ncbi:MAG: TonB-dependent receptor [Chloroherpetonaceae bacterium]